MNVAVEDLHRVIEAARRRCGGKVVLGGHSLGGSVVDRVRDLGLQRQPGAADLAGLVYIDGGQRPDADDAPHEATQSLADARTPSVARGSRSAGSPRRSPGCTTRRARCGAARPERAVARVRLPGCCPRNLKPPVPVDQRRPVRLRAQRRDLAAEPARGAGAPRARLAHDRRRRGWDGTGALTPIKRYATMFSGAG